MILSVVQKGRFYDCLAEPPGFSHGEYQIKTSEFFKISLTHIETALTVTCSGYNELEVMKECLSKLNDLVFTYNFNNEILETNTTLNKEVYTKTISDSKK